MSKRFIDTEIFNDEWFFELKAESKLFWIYYLTQCDHAGLLKYNKKLIEFQTGIKSLETVLQDFSNRILRVKEQLFFCPKFIHYQYPDFPKSKVNQQDGALKLLIQSGIWDVEANKYTTVIEQLMNTSATLHQVLPKTYGNGNGNVKGGGGENFNVFWKAYPKKKSKGDAMSAWKKIKPNDELFKKIMQSLETEKKSTQWKKEGGQYVPYPASWLNSMGWENESDETTENKKEPHQFIEGEKDALMTMDKQEFALWKQNQLEKMKKSS